MTPTEERPPKPAEPEDLSRNPDGYEKPSPARILSFVFLLLAFLAGAFIAIVSLIAASDADLNAFNELTVYILKTVLAFGPVFNFLGLIFKKPPFALTGMLLYIAAGICLNESITWIIYGAAALLSLLGYACLVDQEREYYEK